MRAAPAKLLICGAAPYVQENPMRGLTYNPSGTPSFETPNRRFTSAFSEADRESDSRRCARRR